MKDVNTSILQRKDFKSVQKSIYCKKIKVYTAFSEALIEAVTGNMKNYDVVKYKGQQFIYVHDKEHI